MNGIEWESVVLNKCVYDGKTSTLKERNFRQEIFLLKSSRDKYDFGGCVGEATSSTNWARFNSMLFTDSWGFETTSGILFAEKFFDGYDPGLSVVLVESKKINTN